MSRDPVDYPLKRAEPLRLWRGWVPDADAVFQEFLNGLPWAQHTIGTPAGRIPCPRLECWLAGTEGVEYTYSGERHVSKSIWDYPRLAEIRGAVERTTGHYFDTVFCNLYRGPSDSVGWHADNERELGPPAQVVIASVSLGAKRVFEIKSHDGWEKVSMHLGGGDLLIMGHGVQSAYLHRVPKTNRECGPRVNLTFRRMGR